MLFRQEVFEARKRRLWGDVRLAQPPSLAIWTAVLGAVGVVVIIGLVFGTYVRKETVNGYMVPDTGVIQVVAPRLGRVAAVRAHEGDIITAESVVVEFVDETVGVGGDPVLAAQMVQLQGQIRSEQDRRSADQASLTSEATGLRERIGVQEASKRFVRDRMTQQREAIAIAERRRASYQDLMDKGFGAQARMDELSAQVLAYRGDLTNSQRELQAIDGSIVDLNSQLRALEPRARGLSAATDGNLAGLEQRLIDMSAGSRFAVRAPVTGVISSSQVEVGQTTQANQPLMSVMPSGSELQAELLLPTKAAGFIDVGDEVRLRVDAFPFQRFGAVEGRIVSVSRSVVRPGEFLAPIEFRESMYRVRVAIAADNIVAYGARQPLRPGMTVAADIVIDRRPLWRQLFDPLLAARQRLS